MGRAFGSSANLKASQGRTSQENKSKMRLAVILAGLLVVSTNAACAETFEVGGITRTYTAIIPKTTPSPLVMVLHGNTQQGEDMRTRTSWPDVAKREGLVAVFPDGLNRAWADLRGDSGRVGRSPPKGTDDAAFLTALVAKFIHDGVADPKRIYVTGVSNGGHMTMTLACTHAEMFAAAASVIANFTEAMLAACKPPRPVPMLMMNGTADPLIAYNGGRGTSRYAVPNVVSTDTSIAFWRNNNGCSAGDRRPTRLPDKDKDDSSTVTRLESDYLLAATSCSIASTVAATACQDRFPMRTSCASSMHCSARRTTTSTAPKPIWAFFRGHTLP